MKLRHFFILGLFVLFSQMAVAKTKSSVEFDRESDLIPPDMLLLRKGLEAQEDGFRDSAMRYFKKAAAFGNNDAKYFVGMMNIQEKDWAEGYAWLKLVPAGTVDIDTTMPQIESLIKDGERKSAMKKHEKLAKKYSPEEELRYREEWANNIEVTGTRQKGLNAMRGVTVQTQYGRVITGAELKRMVEEFVYDYGKKKQ